MPRLKIDKSLFSPEELAQYEALIAKASVPEEEEEEKFVPPSEPPKKTKKQEPPETEEEEEEDPVSTQKSASPELTAALEELADLRKSFEMQEMTTIAKKYAPLGKKEDELAQTLYNMKKSNPANYEAYVAILDESLDMVNKSGLFTEIGKSYKGGGGGSAVEKVEAAASELQKSDPTMSRATAIAKAWENHPELADEYDAEYRA